MCFGSDDPAPAVIRQTNDLPEWVDQGGKENYDLAKEIASRPYEAYEGQRIAGFTPDMATGFDMAKSGLGAWQQPLSQAMQATSDVAGTNFTNADIGAYMNPFTQQVTNQGLRELGRQGEITRNDISMRAQGAGAFDGARHGVIEAEQRRNQTQAESDLINRNNANAFTVGQQAFQSDQAMNLAAGGQLSQLGGLAQQMGLADADAMINIGEAGRSLEQGNIDLAYEDFLRQRDYPLTQLNIQQAALATSPYSTESSRIQPFQQSSGVADAIGAFGLAAGGLGSLAQGGGFSSLFA